MAKLLLEAGDCPREVASTLGKQILKDALFSADIELCRLLFEVGVDPNCRGGDVPLIQAVDWGHLDLVKYLLTLPAVNVNRRDRYGRTPLLLAAGTYHFQQHLTTALQPTKLLFSA